MNKPLSCISNTCPININTNVHFTKQLLLNNLDTLHYLVKQINYSKQYYLFSRQYKNLILLTRSNLQYDHIEFTNEELININDNLIMLLNNNLQYYEIIDIINRLKIYVK